MKTRVSFLELSGHAVVVLPVKPDVAEDIERAKAAIIKYKPHFPKHLVVLMGNGLRPVFVGKGELVHQLDAMEDGALVWTDIELTPAGYTVL
ncbi:conserved hypothetical protein [Rhodospirillaceae bacterium LM-1]|nr:conserved hypothetical protein [Rhodospirillaceae bacterium LM-1]